MTTPEPFKVEAIVLMNGEEAFVLNRKPQPVYEFDGRDLIGRDGPFVDYLYYQAPSGRFKAFAGREFRLPMSDGSTVLANGQYWQGSLNGTVSTAWGTKDYLKSCYVFSNGAWDARERQRLRDEYKGEVYPYWSYEALLKLPDLRVKAFLAKQKFERAKAHILKNMSAIKAERDALRAPLSPAVLAALPEVQALAEDLASCIAMIQHAIGEGKDVFIEPDTGKKLSDARARLEAFRAAAIREGRA